MGLVHSDLFRKKSVEGLLRIGFPIAHQRKKSGGGTLGVKPRLEAVSGFFAGVLIGSEA